MPCSFHLDRSKIPGFDGRGAELGEGCQFGVPEDELYSVSGRQFCGFHLQIGWPGKSEIGLDWFNEQIFHFVNAARKEGRIVDLSGVHFPGPISFDGYTDPNGLPDVLFAQAHFRGEASFQGATFGGMAVFSSAVFTEMPIFDDTVFHDITAFNGASYSRGARFTRAEFRDRASFEGADWHDYAQFHAARFSQLVNFSDAMFHEGSQFQEAVFERKASFVRTVFGGDALFAKSRFDRDVFFNAATFGGPLLFQDSAFNGSALFGSGSGGSFPRPALKGVFEAHNRIYGADFRRTTFAKRADFSNRLFISRTDFRDAIFNVAPEFYGSELHQDTDFAGADFRDHKGNEQVDAARAYRTLKLAMEQARATREQAMFFRHEQRSLRLRSDTLRSLKAISWLYEIMSDYGESPIRPLVGVGLAFVAFFFLYFAIQTSGKLTLCWAEIEATLLFTARQVFMPFRIFISDPPSSLGLALLGALHSLLNISFIALFIIALRRKFRLV